MKMLANTLFINGVEYVIPGGMSDKDVTTLAAMLLRFRRVDEVYSSDYKTRFPYQEMEYVSVRLSERQLYVSEGVARQERDAHNATLPAEPVTS